MVLSLALSKATQGEAEPGRTSCRNANECQWNMMGGGRLQNVPEGKREDIPGVGAENKSLLSAAEQQHWLLLEQMLAVVKGLTTQALIQTENSPEYLFTLHYEFDTIGLLYMCVMLFLFAPYPSI